MNFDQAIEAALALLNATARARFAYDPLGVLRGDLALSVQAASHLTNRADGGACDGMSFLRDGVILYAPSPNSRRQNFTLAHELGHWLIDQSEAVFDWIGDQEDTPRVLEALCDRIAQRLLLPDDTVDTALPGSAPVRARDVLQLYNASEASRPVCAIALARRLPGAGAVTIIDRSSAQVQYATVHPDPIEGWPIVFPWPGQAVPIGHPFRAVADGATVTRRALWRDRWDRQQNYYVDAITDGPRLVAVFSTTDLWAAERLHLDSPPVFDQRPSIDIRCCGRTRTVRGWPCPNCGEPDCPECRSCRCQRQERREQPCAGTCYLQYQPHLLVSGLCENCR